MTDDLRDLLRSADGGPGRPDLDDIRRRGRRLVATRVAAVFSAVAVAAVGVVGIAVGLGADGPDRLPIIDDPAPVTPPPEDDDVPEDAVPDDPAADDEDEDEDEPTEDTDGVTAADEQLIDDFLRFAADPGPDTAAQLPFAGEVALGLADDLHLRRAASELSDPDVWVVDVEEFRGYAGPFSVLEVAARADDTVTSVGDHPHCVSPPVPAPAEFVEHRRVSVQAVMGDDDSCLQWWTADLFVTDDGRIAAVTLDLYEP